MGKLGNWIDGLTDEQKDRIVRGQKWRTQCVIDSKDQKCLVGHAAGYYVEKWTDTDGSTGRRVDCVTRVASVSPGNRFDALVDRFGLDRIVRVCKQRAAATMSTEVETPAPVEVMSADPLNSLYSEGA